MKPEETISAWAFRKRKQCPAIALYRTLPNFSLSSHTQGLPYSIKHFFTIKSHRWNDIFSDSCSFCCHSWHTQRQESTVPHHFYHESLCEWHLCSVTFTDSCVSNDNVYFIVELWKQVITAYTVQQSNKILLQRKSKGNLI